MDLFLTILGAIAGLTLGMFAGLRVGQMLRERRNAWYWAANAAVLVLGAAGNLAGLVFDQWWLVVGSLALIGGGLTGLKYGLGRSVGVWRMHDDFVRSDDLPRG